MAALNELIQKIENPELRAQIQEAANKLTKQKKFGLVFEEHLPECTPLYDIPVRKGAKVSVRNEKANEIYTVLKIENDKALCLSKSGDETKEFDINELVTTAELGDPIYPCLQPLGEVSNAPDSELWHTLIEADNYHALQLLEYLYAGKVDCIYIDPPYNSGATDWKYNNKYVDENDEYKHSKWLSFMQKRLEIAKRLLNPNDSMLIVAIDDKEGNRLGLLLESIFTDAKITMISSVINPEGKAKKGGTDFSKVDEYIYFVQIGNAVIQPEKREVEKTPFVWEMFRRHSRANGRGVHGVGSCGPNQFYPIYVDNTTKRIVKIGEPIAEDVDRFSVDTIEGCTTVFPVRDDGTEMNWGAIPEEARKRLDQGYMKVTSYDPRKPQPYAINYLTSGTIKKINNGDAIIEGIDEQGCVIGYFPEGKPKMPTTHWNKQSHKATTYGTLLLNSIIGHQRFNYPKSLYAVMDCLKTFVVNKPQALIVDFFAGSGTTLHAVNLINAVDGGSRRCIMVTNNEVSPEEAKSLTSKGFNPGDEEWNSLGIARYVTWPRTVCSIEGRDINGSPLEDVYGVEVEAFEKSDDDVIVSKKTGKITKKTVYKKVNRNVYPELAKIHKSDGFETNAVFFKLGFLDKTKVSLGMQFKELLSTLWMKAGAIGKCPVIDDHIPDMMILPANKMAILNNENLFGEFADQLAQHPEIEVVYLVTDYESSFIAMTQKLEGKQTYQLYRDYLDNFRINAGRNGR